MSVAYSVGTTIWIGYIEMEAVDPCGVDLDGVEKWADESRRAASKAR
jgi:hypothetical protein